MHDLTGFQRDLLYTILTPNEPSGTEVKEILEERYEEEIHHGRLYPNLDTLIEKDLLIKGSLDDRTNYYRVSRKGHQMIKARRQWERSCLDSESDSRN